MAANSPVTASTPFLTVDQAATELGLHPNAIPRLIALRALDGLRQSGDGEWKLRPAALEKYLAAGCPRANAPLADYEAGWYSDRELMNYAGQFENLLRDKLASFFPPQCPFSTLSHGEYRALTLTADQKTAVLALAAKAAFGPVFTKADKPSLFRSCGHQYVAAQLLRLVAQESTPTLTQAVNDRLTNWKVLFDSPESYRSCVDRAWAALQNAKISVHRQ